MPIATVIGSFTLFLVLAYLLPGITIFMAGVLMFYPGVLEANQTLNIDPLIGTGLFLVVSYLQSPVAIAAENWFFNKVWGKSFAGRDFSKKREVTRRRSEIIAHAEAQSVAHAYYDQSFGEFVLSFNTGVWIVIMALAKLVISIFTPWDWGCNVAWILLVAGTVNLFYVSPLFKMRYLDALSALEVAVNKKSKNLEEGQDSEV